MFSIFIRKSYFGRKCWYWRLTLWYPCLLQVFGFDNFSNTVCETSLNIVCKGTIVLPIISLSELTKMQWQVENIEKSKKLYIFLLLFIFFQPLWYFLGSYLVNLYFTLIFDHISQYKLDFHCFVKRVQWRILSLRNSEKNNKVSFCTCLKGYRNFALKCLFFCYKYIFKRRNCLEIEPIRRKNALAQGYDARKGNNSCVYSAYILKPVLSERNL